MHGTYGLGKDYIFIAKLTKKSTNFKNENLQKDGLIKKISYLLNNNKFETAGIIAVVSFYLLL